MPAETLIIVGILLIVIPTIFLALLWVRIEFNSNRLPLERELVNGKWGFRK